LTQESSVFEIYEKLLNERLYKKNYTPAPERVLFKIRGENIGSIGNFIVVSGLPKAGKSTFINAALSSSFILERNKFNMSLQALHDRPVIGYFDTESAEYDFYKNINRIKSMAHINDLPYNFSAFNTRQDSAEINRALIETFCKIMKSSIIVIDGLLDCVNNYNDETESRAVINWLKRITTENEVLIIGVVHTGKRDNHTLGHFGSMVDRYAQSVLEVTKEEETNIYRMSAKYLRSAPTFEDVCIQWGGSGFVEAYNVPKKETAGDRRRR
jgi:archaellum biogenesis ATPase FlaH